MSTSPITLFTDTAAIEAYHAAVANAKPYAETVFNKYNQVTGTRTDGTKKPLPILTANDWDDIFFDCIKFIENAKVKWYRVNYSDLHEPIFINEEKGVDLVSDKLPAFDQLIAAVKAYNSAMCQTVAPPQAYTIDESGNLIVNQANVDAHRASHTLVLDHQIELDAKIAIEGVIGALQSLAQALPQNAFRLLPDLLASPQYNLNQLHELIVFQRPFDQSAPSMSINIEFFRKLKSVVKNTN